MTAKELITGEYSMYDRIQQAIREAHQQGDRKIYVGREFYKDEHVLWLDNDTMKRLEADGFSIEPFHNHEWKIKW